MSKDKVKLTYEQSVALEKLLNKNGGNKSMTVDKIYAVFYNEDSYFVLSFSSLNDVAPDELVRALYEGYDVEDELVKGDWVVMKLKSATDFNRCFKIKEVNEHTITLEHPKHLEAVWTKEELGKYLIRATKEEIENELKLRKWESIGRKVNEYKNGDIVYQNYDKEDMYIVSQVLDDSISLRFFTLLGKSDSIWVDNKNFLQDFSLLCPVESRFDIQ